MKKALLAFSAFLMVVILMGCVTTTTSTTTTTSSTTTTTTTTSSTTTTTTTTGTTTTTTTEPTDTYPVISGADDVTIQKNSGFVPLAGVSAWDQEDGDLTGSISYSGNVNPNAVGVYVAHYTVIDSDGNITTVDRTVTVVFTDSAAPLIAGVANETIYVGEAIDLLEGITATDTVDGSVEVTVTGSVDIWTPGEYDLVYSAEDEAGNRAEMPRKITVSFGDFVFGDAATVDFGTWTVADGVYTSPALTGFVINDSIADFTYLKLVLTVRADAAGNASIAVGDSPVNLATLPLTTEDQVFTLYFVLDSGSTADSIVLTATGLTLTVSATTCFAEVRDMVAPTLNVPSDEAAYIVNLSQAGLESYLLKGVTAVDDIDGNLTSAVTIDYGTLDLSTVGVYDVTYRVTDEGGNEATFVRHVTIGNAVDSGYLSDPTFQNAGNGQWNEKSNDGDVDITYDAAAGTMAILVNNDGNWQSAAGAYFSQSTSGLEADVWYCFTFTVKTTLDRTMWIRMGLQTDQAHGWLDDFDGNASGNALSITTEYQTFHFYFKLDSLTSTSGDSIFKIELNLGDPNYGNKGNGQTTTFQNVAMYKVVTEFADPTFTENFSSAVQMPTIFTVGAAEPDWATYVTAKDMSNNVLTPVVTESVDMNVPGNYVINYSVTDSHGKTASYVLNVTVVAAEAADTVGPVITKADGIPDDLTFDQFTSVQVNYAALVTIHDDLDGDITPTLAMVDDGGLDFNVAGVYTVTYTCYDKSGNVGTVSYTVTISDKQVPNINLSDLTVNFGEAFDPLEGLIVTDNVDGTIPNANVTVTGLEQFVADGKVNVEGVFTIVYTVTDAAGNTAVKNVTVTVSNIVWDEDLAAALLGNQDEGPSHSVLTYDETEQVWKITAIDPNTDSWDHARLVWYFTAGTEIIAGQTYKFEITVKADVATDLYFRIGSTLWVDPWIDNFDGGLKTVAITTEYVTYQVIFTADKAMVNGNAKFQFMYGYLSTDAANTIYIQSFDLVPEKQPTYVEVADLVSEGTTTGSISAMTGSNVEGILTLTGIPAYTYDWMTGRITFMFDQSVLEYGETYRIAITLKATSATKVRFYMGTTLSADPWIDAFTGMNKTDLNITTDYVTYYLLFTVDAASYQSANSAKFEFSVGYNAGDETNTVSVSDMVIEKVIPPHNIDALIVDEFVYADEDAMEANWTLRVNGSNSLDPSDKVTLDADYDFVNFALPDTANGGWWILRRYATLASFGVTDEYKILAFYMTNNTNVTSASVWLYWNGTQNAFTINLPAIGETGWATIDVTVTGAQASAITDFGLAFNNWASSPVTGSLDIYEIACVKDVSELDYFQIAVKPAPHVLDVQTVDDFTYADEDAMEANWTLRVNGSNSLDPSDKVTLDAENDLLVFELPATANEGWWILRRYATLASLGVTDEYKILSFYVTNNTNVTSASVWLYWSGSQNAYAVTLPAIGESGWVTIDVTKTGYTPSGITDFGLAFSNYTASGQVTGSLDIYDIVCVKAVSELDYLEIALKPEPVNTAPVVSISDANLAILSGLTLKAGENIESLAATLLGMVSIADAEDGAITPTAAMVSLGGLDLTNPVMGSYTLTVSCVDSEGLASNVYSLQVSIVTVLNDFESYADDAAFKASATDLLYGFRSQPVAGTTWAAANGALVTTGEENTLQLSYAYVASGTNGIRLKVTKSSLESLGATYVGIYVKTSAALSSGSLFQAFWYNASGSYNSLTVYGTPGYADEGTYVYVKVADLPSDTASVSFLINVVSADSGTLTLDNLVIK